MKYLFCSLCLGKSYADSCIDFSKKLYSFNKSAKHLLVSDQDKKTFNSKNIIFKKFNDELQVRNPTQPEHFNFNYNLKYYPIKESINQDVDFIFFIDADWQIDNSENGFSIEKIEDLLQWFNKSEYDFLFERPHAIGGSVSKEGLCNCFFKHKIEPFKLSEKCKYKNAHVCNEQFLLFKNNSKLKKFVQAWEDRYHFCVKNNVWQFAEGVEIGMSAADAKMKSTYGWPYDAIRNCFIFETKQGLVYNRW